MPEPSSTPRCRVTAVIVAHDGHVWLPTLLRSLRRSTRAPDVTVAVDTGSADDTRELLVDALGEAAVHNAARGTGFGAAVAQGLDGVPVGDDPAAEWVWLLHDDCAPEPDALELMLAQAVADRSIAVVGPKLRAWPTSRRLKEVGLTISGSGRREVGVVAGERDQGQRDDVGSVMAVSTAGMLVRRDVFDAVGGFDRALPLYYDDIDLGWRVAAHGYRTVVCPRAVVHHDDASAEGRRPVHASGKGRRRHRRAAAMYVLLANASKKRLPWTWARLVVGSLLRVLGLLLGKAPRAAWQELRALADTVTGLRHLHRGRALRARAMRAAPDVEGSATRRARSLMAPFGAYVRTIAEDVAVVASTAGTGGSVAAGGGRHRAAAVESGPVAEEAEGLTGPESLWWRRLLHPTAVSLVVLLVVTVVAHRALLHPRLTGGALAPWTADISTSWTEYLAAWHGVGLGSHAIAPSWFAVVAALTTVSGGHGDVALTVLLLGSVPLSGLTAALAARAVISGRPARVWACCSYGLLPIVTGAVSQGRFTTCLVLIVLPLLLVAVRRAMTGGRFLRGSWPATFTTGLLLGLATACEPVLFAVFVGAGLLAAALARSLQWSLRSLVVGVTAAAVNMPFIPALLQHPRLIAAQPGIAGAGAEPGGAGWWLHPLPGSLGLSVALPVLAVGALAGALRHDRGRPALVAWVVVLVSGAVAVAQRGLRAPMPDGGATPIWPGTAIAIGMAALIAAAAIGADGAVARFRQAAFSWRQPVSLLVAAACALLPVAAAGLWLIRGTEGPLRPQGGDTLPAYIAAQQRSPQGARTLLLVPSADGRTVTPQLLRAPSWGLLETAVAPSARGRAPVERATERLLVDQDDAALDGLAALGISYVYVEDSGDALPPVLDAIDGLTRASAPEGSAAWSVDRVAGPMRIVGGERARLVVADPRDATVAIEAGTSRRLQVAEASSTRWKAAWGERDLTAATSRGIVVFDLPDEAGTLRVRFDDRARTLLLWGQAAALVAAVVLAFPGFARQAEADATLRVRGRSV